MDKDDANNLAVPIAEVAKLYDVKIDPRLEAYGSLCMAVAFVYGPKINAIMQRRRGANARDVTPRHANGLDAEGQAAGEQDLTQMTRGRFSH